MILIFLIINLINLGICKVYHQKSVIKTNQLYKQITKINNLLKILTIKDIYLNLLIFLNKIIQLNTFNN